MLWIFDGGWIRTFNSGYQRVCLKESECSSTFLKHQGRDGFIRLEGKNDVMARRGKWRVLGRLYQVSPPGLRSAIIPNKLAHIGEDNELVIRVLLNEFLAELMEFGTNVERLDLNPMKLPITL